MVLKNFIWDFDGTLFDTYPVMTQALRLAMDKQAVSFDGDLDRYIKDYSISQFAREFADSTFLDDYHKFEHQLQAQPPVYPEIPSILREIKAAGGQHFVLSHRDATTVEHLGDLAGLFTEIITSEQHFARKPDPEALNYLIDKYQLKRDETAMLGDRPLDVQAGKNAGLFTALFDEHDYFGAIADLKIRKWSDFTNDFKS